MKIIAIWLMILVLASCGNDDDNNSNDNNTTDKKEGNLLVYFHNVDLPNTLTINNKDYSSDIINTNDNNYCSDPDYNQYKIPVTVGANNILFASNGLVTWTIENINVTKENECLEIRLDNTNITSPAKYKVELTNDFESGIRETEVSLDGNFVGTLNETTTNPNAPGATASVIIKEITAGNHTYSGIGQNGHTWHGSFEAVNGRTVGINFTKYTAENISNDKCNIVFYSPNFSNITVNLENNYIGTALVWYDSNTTDFCIRKWVVSIIKPIGVYNYNANSGAHNWSGNVNANIAGGCVVVKLE